MLAEADEQKPSTASATEEGPQPKEEDPNVPVSMDLIFCHLSLINFIDTDDNETRIVNLKFLKFVP